MSPPVIPEPAPNAQLLRSLGRLVRGLSALFWSLPVALVVCVQAAKTDVLRSFNILPPVLVTGWICYGIWQLGSFQRQERIWQQSLERAKFLALVDLGLSPFLFWWNQMPGEPFFTSVVSIMAVTGLLFLGSLNLVLHRLSAMLPDEGLRQETRLFTTLNRYLVLGILLLAMVLSALMRFPWWLPAGFNLIYSLNINVLWLLIFLVLLPLAMTMALLWKIKEVILDSVFGAGH